MAGTRLLRHHRVDMRRHRRGTSHLQPVTSLHRQATNRRRKAIRRRLPVGMRLRLHVQPVLPHLRAGILCRRVAWPTLLWT